MSNANHRDLYDYLVTLIPNTLFPMLNYKIPYQLDKDKKLDNLPHRIFFDIKGRSGKQIASGEYILRTVQVTMNIVTGRSKDDQTAGYDYCEEICDKLDILANKKVSINNKELFICKTKKLGDYSHEFDTSQAQNCFIIDYLITYR